MSAMPVKRVKATDDAFIEITDHYGDIMLEIDGPTYWMQVQLDEQAAGELLEWLTEYFRLVRRADADA